MMQNSRKRKYNERNKGRFKEPEPQFSSQTLTLVDRVLDQISPRGLLVFIQDEDQSPRSVLHGAAGHAGISIKYQPVNPNCPTTWQVIIGDEVVTQGSATSSKMAQENLTTEALKVMQKYCFTMERKRKLTEGPLVSVEGKIEEKKPMVNSPPVSGLGAKMMLKMGWKGGGLGAEEQGQQNLIEAYHQVDRQGLGTLNITGQISKILQDYVDKQSFTSLAFSSEFTHEERKQIHMLALKFNLRSKSYGKGESRTLVISPKITRWDMVKRLLDMGGENEQYRLIYPTEIN